MNLDDKLRAAARSVSVWVNAALLAIFPFTDQIVQGVSDYLPALAPYLPANIYKMVGFAVVVFNIARAAQKAHQLAQARAPHG